MVTLTLEEVAKHNTEKDCWIIFKGKVYEVTDYLEDHPGGVEIITDLAGQDCTEDFEDVGHSQEAYDQLEEYYIGDVGSDSSDAGVEVVENVEITETTVMVDDDVVTTKTVDVETKTVYTSTPSTNKSKSNNNKSNQSDDGGNTLLIAGGVAAVAMLGYFLVVRKK
uniref:Cytochrome b5 heme-binding domain-containing protein n=2 Tax=Sar TaxID=2698737 RepID=A0A6S8FYB3_9STRA|mmetsp:Transcript_18625/g.22753  ORF Transcript_18625/g.22753 Transcript_18625/m.22753 type:complete len:166 (+) Transcript_18625:302-799(+)|eukprot:CAMPEP_0204843138 /NCGR_PEP_ID=MMETSP1346-20131115/47798_1 /ASSEMBLY_ACC=CAM_ASM_000771 /TAXON_ID=215587 /ORGANISM="Aplanochytrium stocchinoi, Strain GSBS06" /LENGTH=165 /DNA_ID=CAMNT_0051982223 /DNA_START=234 /DNA_END=731 /DNA_ORIENTATION=+